MEKLKDNSLSYSPNKGSWTIRLDDGESYTMYPFHAASSQRRTTTVFLGWKEDDLRGKPLTLKHSSLQDDARTRLVLSSVGKPLSQCPSVFELLLVFFDLVVAHQKMCERDVLHRDISWGNIMCGTADGRYQEGTTVSEKDIADILKIPNRSPTVTTDGRVNEVITKR